MHVCLKKKITHIFTLNSNVFKIVHGWVNKDRGTSNPIGKSKISLGELVTPTVMNICESESVSICV